jgi:hypothetical protein
VDTVEQASQTLAEILGSKPFWSREVSGVVSYRIDRFVCRGRNLTVAPLAQPVLVTQFRGKKVSLQEALEQVTSFPSVSTLIPAGTETSWAIQSSLDFAVVYFRGEALQQLQQNSDHLTEPAALTSPLCCSLTKELAELVAVTVKSGEETKVGDCHKTGACLLFCLFQPVPEIFGLLTIES